MTGRSRQRTADILAKIEQVLVEHGARLTPECLREIADQRDKKRAKK